MKSSIAFIALAATCYFLTEKIPSLLASGHNFTAGAFTLGVLVIVLIMGFALSAQMDSKDEVEAEPESPESRHVPGAAWSGQLPRTNSHVRPGEPSANVPDIPKEALRHPVARRDGES